jgi:hypothetical protein
MRSIVIATLLLLVPAVLLGGQTMGVYFTYVPNQMYYSPAPFEPMTAYVYGHALNCFTSGIEFGIQLPPGIIMTGWSVPEGSLTIGDPLAGLAVTYFPPLNGFDPGYNLLAKVELLALPDGACLWYGGTIVNAPLRVVADPTSGAATPRQACYPDMYLVDVIGLTSIICPDMIATEETSWGAIKSLF